MAACELVGDSVEEEEGTPHELGAEPDLRLGFRLDDQLDGAGLALFAGLLQLGLPEDVRRTDDFHPLYTVDLGDDVDGVVLIADDIDYDFEVVLGGLEEVGVASGGVVFEVVLVDLAERAGQALEGGRAAVLAGPTGGGEADVELDLLVVAVPHADVGDVAALQGHIVDLVLGESFLLLAVGREGRLGQFLSHAQL